MLVCLCVICGCFFTTSAKMSTRHRQQCPVKPDMPSGSSHRFANPSLDVTTFLTCNHTDPFACSWIAYVSYHKSLCIPSHSDFFCLCCVCVFVRFIYVCVAVPVVPSFSLLYSVLFCEYATVYPFDRWSFGWFLIWRLLWIMLI